MLKDQQYIPKNTNVTLHFAYANKYFGFNQDTYTDIQFKDPKHVKAPFIVKKDILIAGTTGYINLTVIYSDFFVYLCHGKDRFTL